MNTEMIEEILKPCPFCGGNAEIIQTGAKSVKVRCVDCLIGLEQSVLRNTLDWLKSRLIQKWNTRKCDIEFAKWLEENTKIIYEEKITLYRYCDNGNEYGNYTLDDVYLAYKEKENPETF